LHALPVPKDIAGAIKLVPDGEADVCNESYISPYCLMWKKKARGEVITIELQAISKNGLLL